MRDIRIRDYMTPAPETIGSHQTLAAAHMVMREHRIRHLPVLASGRLVGIVSQRDLHFIETLRDVDPKEVTVDDAMTRDPYAVRPSARLGDVARRMAEGRLGSAVVLEHGRIAGVFTTTDALRALADLTTSTQRLRVRPRARKPSSGR